jgi:hypothetical protein
MAKRDYERLSIEDFGAHLLSTGDLDPVYIALWKSDFEFEVMARWLVAYWCLYHCGAASYLAGLSDAEFWDTLMVAAINKEPAPTGGRWPRAAERRHWRGQQAVNSVESLRSWETAAELVHHLQSGDMDFAAVSKRVQNLRGFGPWIAFKVADMIDRVICRPVNFDEAAVFMFKDPAKAAIMLWDQRHPDLPARDVLSTRGAIAMMVEYLTKVFASFQAPPLNDRPVGLQEVETVLCKWKSHMNGHYPLFKDTDEINEGLLEWAPHSEIARRFATHMPRSHR